MINLHEIPMVRAVLPFMFGILAAAYATLPSLPPFFVFFLLFLTLLIHRKTSYTRRHLFGLNLTFLLFSLGVLAVQEHDELRVDTHFQKHLCPNQQDTVIAWVADMPKLGKWVQVRLQVESYNQQFEATGSLLAYVERDSSSEQLNYGDRLIFSQKIYALEAPKNPNAFDYRRHLALQNIHYQTYIDDDDWQPLKGQRGGVHFRFIYDLRKKLLSILAVHFPSDEELAVAAALILGKRDNLSDEVRAAYANTGAIHILAVSGLHVGLIYMLVTFLLQRMPQSTPAWRFTRMSITIGCIWTFALLTGSSPSVLRAATMFTFLAGAEQLHRFTSIYNTLAAASLTSLVLNPLLLFQVGFQLSYGAVLGIVYFHPKIMLRSYRIYKNNKHLKHICSLLAVSVAAQLAVTPLGLYYFHQFPIWFWLSSIIVVPAAFAILSLGILLFLLTPLVPPLAYWCGLLLYGLVALVNYLVFQIEKLPFGLVRDIWLQLHELYLLYILLIAGSIAWNYKHRITLWVTMLTLVLFLASRSYEVVHQLEQRQISIYHVKGGTLIDCFDGTTSYTLQSNTLSRKQIKYAAEQHRRAKGIATQHTCFLEQDTLIEKGAWYYEPPFIQFQEQRLVIVDNAMELPILEKPIRVNAVLLQQNPRVSIEALRKTFDFDLMIMDATNYPRKRKAWQQECELIGIRCYNMAEEGAWIWQK
ncbi:MAG: ComEC/Rec2 family competence protein [Bacteroidota bacterium]